MASKQTTFTPSLSEAKAASTTSVVKGIVEKQSADRQAKTDRLRAARLEKEISMSKAEPPAKKRKATTSKRSKP